LSRLTWRTRPLAEDRDEVVDADDLVARQGARRAGHAG